MRVCMQVQFDLAEEYVELLYRQFIVLLGMTTFPLITALGAIGYVLECVLPAALAYSAPAAAMELTRCGCACASLWQVLAG